MLPPSAKWLCEGWPGHLEQTLHNWIEANPDVVLEDSKVLIIGREVRSNLDSYIDLLGIDREGDVVVVEVEAGPVLPWSGKEGNSPARQGVAWVGSGAVRSLLVIMGAASVDPPLRASEEASTRTLDLGHHTVNHIGEIDRIAQTWTYAAKRGECPPYSWYSGTLTACRASV